MTILSGKISGDWLTAAHVQQVLGILTDAGHLGLLVGGCVRNAALGQPVADIDIATDADPETVVTIARAAGLKPVPTGIEHGTVTIIAQGVPHEVTTFRRDVETDGRHATVAFSTEIAEDAARRDFTINALYAEADGTVLDPLGTGLEDLARRHVRFVGTPEARIREDYLRILRFFRFTAVYGDPDAGPDAEGLAACAALAEGIAGLSRERIGQEMRKLLAARDPAPTVATMSAAGVLAQVLPGADATPLAPLVYFEETTGLSDRPDPIRRLAAIGGEDPAERFRLSRADGRRLERLRRMAFEDMPAAVLGYRLGEADARDATLIRAALIGAPPPDATAEAIAFGAAQRLPVKASDLPPGLVGAEIGAALSRIEARWIASGFTLDRAALLA